MKDFQIANIRVSVTVPVESLKSLALKKFRIKEEEVELFRILRSSVDARKKKCGNPPAPISAGIPTSRPIRRPPR